MLNLILAVASVPHVLLVVQTLSYFNGWITSDIRTLQITFNPNIYMFGLKFTYWTKSYLDQKLFAGL